MMMQRIEDFVRARFAEDATGHDWYHVGRVRDVALCLARHEGADPIVVELAALLHDVADWKFHGGDIRIGPAQAEKLLQQEGAPSAMVDHVCEIIRDISFKGSGVTTNMRTIEGKVVQDADRLDAIGAVGIARCFAYGGAKGRLLHDPAEAPVHHKDFESYRKAQGSSLNHFYEKLFLLKDRMNTVTGRAMAEQRDAFMKIFVRQFLAEWEGTL